VNFFYFNLVISEKSKAMKNLLILVGFSIILISCQENESANEFTGNEITYDLQSTSQYDISGVVTLKEKRDGTTQLIVKLSNTSGQSKLPVHLHLGDISTPGADVAALLSPINAKTGISETVLKQLADESEISYSDLIKLNACVKIHLSDIGPERDIILASGNIGASVAKSIESGRTGLAPCKSE
jgi:hypothetical protein